MRAKPKHLSEPYASQWEDACMADDYPHRPPYPSETFDILVGLLGDPAGGSVLDLGCGTGDLARPLAARVDRVDAMDRSAAMVARGRELPGGDRVRWQVARAEDVRPDPSCGLVVLGESMHWMEWDRLLPRLAGRTVALVWREEAPPAWEAELRRVIPEYSTNTDFEPYSLVDELERRGLFRFDGVARVPPAPFAQPIDAYVACFHSRNGFSRARMAPERAAAFDASVRELVAPHCPDGIVRFDVGALVRWGAAT